MFLSLCRYLLTERRALRRSVLQLQAKLEVETERNRQREDELTSRWLTSNGAYGIPARKPKQTEKHPLPGSTPTDAPLTALEEMRLNAWIEAGEAAGKTRADVEQLFREQRHVNQLETYQPPAGMF